MASNLTPSNATKSDQYKPDPRFKIAHREALIGVALAIFNFHLVVRLRLRTRLTPARRIYIYPRSARLVLL